MRVMKRRAVHSTFVRICLSANHLCEVRARVSVRGDGIFNHQITLELLGCCPMPHGTALLLRLLFFPRGTPTISIVLFRLGGDTPVTSEASELRNVATMMSFNSILLARPWEKCQLSPDRHLMHSQGRPECVFCHVVTLWAQAVVSELCFAALFLLPWSFAKLAPLPSSPVLPELHTQDTLVQHSFITARTAHSMRLAWLKFKTKRDLQASLCLKISFVIWCATCLIDGCSLRAPFLHEHFLFFTNLSKHTTRTLSTS